MTILCYGIPNCDTVKKARAWFQAQGLAHEFIDLKKVEVAPLLAAWMAQGLPWERLLNRQGTTWRKLEAAVQAQAQEAAGAAAWMAAQPSLIKRPVVRWADGTLTVGLDAARWTQERAAS